LYSGITNNLGRREHLHNEGKAAQFTKTRRPVRIIFAEKHPDKSNARKREIQIKKWSMGKKENLIKLKPECHI